MVENRIREILAEYKDQATDLDTQRLWSQEAVARRVGISLFTLNRVANGKQLVSKHLQRQIAKVLRRPLEEVFPRAARKARAG